SSTPRPDLERERLNDNGNSHTQTRRLSADTHSDPASCYAGQAEGITAWRRATRPAPCATTASVLRTGGHRQIQPRGGCARSDLLRHRGQIGEHTSELQS